MDHEKCVLPAAKWEKRGGGKLGRQGEELGKRMPRVTALALISSLKKPEIAGVKNS